MENTGNVDLRLSELASELDSKNVPQAYYSLGKERNERTCLVLDGVRWLVYYSEHGEMSDLKECFDFESARKEILTRLVS